MLRPLFASCPSYQYKGTNCEIITPLTAKAERPAHPHESNYMATEDVNQRRIFVPDGTFRDSTTNPIVILNFPYTKLYIYIQKKRSHDNTTPLYSQWAAAVTRKKTVMTSEPQYLFRYHCCTLIICTMATRGTA